jgi:hypothetical protein
LLLLLSPIRAAIWGTEVSLVHASNINRETLSSVGPFSPVSLFSRYHYDRADEQQGADEQQQQPQQQEQKPLQGSLGADEQQGGDDNGGDEGDTGGGDEGNGGEEQGEAQ